MVCKSLQSIIDDPINSLIVGKSATKGNEMIALSRLLLPIKTTEEFHEISTLLVNKVFEILQKVDFCKPTKKEQMCREIFEEYMSPECWDLVLPMVYPIDSTDPIVASLHESVVLNLQEQILKYRHPVIIDGSIDTYADCEISKKEQQVLHYVAGYLIFALEKKYKRLNKNNNIVATAALNFFKSMKISSVTVSANSFMQWTQMNNRGGLKIACDDLFYFVRRIERVVLRILNKDFIKSYKGEDVRELLVTAIEGNRSVFLAWDRLSRAIDNSKLKTLLKKQIIDKWVDIRARSFVKSYVQIVRKSTRNDKEKDGPSVATEPSLRKTLK